MGGGKSTHIINKINDEIQADGWNNVKYLICVPLLTEVERYRNSIKGIYIYDPQMRGSKTIDFRRLISEQKNIVTTHALISKIDSETLDLLYASNYKLVIDECLDAVHEYKSISLKDWEILQEKFITINDKGFLEWNDSEEEYDGIFQEIKKLCEINSLMDVPNYQSNKKKLLMWNFTTTFFEAFQECYILTYGWNGSYFKAYFDLHKIAYNHLTIKNDMSEPYSVIADKQDRKDLKQLINIYEGDLNRIGDKIRGNKSNPLSSTWYTRQITGDKLLLNQLKNNTYNYFRNVVKTPSKLNMWTCYIKAKKYLSGDGYAKGFLSWTMKATNEYKHKTTLAYLDNLFLHQQLISFFKYHKIEIDAEQYATNELMQWVWRSAIRDKKEINIYIPSTRMRSLLNDFINV